MLTHMVFYEFMQTENIKHPGSFFFFKGWEVGELRSRLDAHGEALAAVRSTVLQGRAQTLLWLRCYCLYTYLTTGVCVSSPTEEQVRKGKQPELWQQPLYGFLRLALMNWDQF